MTFRTFAASLLIAVPLMAGCRTDESLAAPDLSNNGGLLARYVAMGNSITAGFIANRPTRGSSLTPRTLASTRITRQQGRNTSRLKKAKGR